MTRVVVDPNDLCERHFGTARATLDRLLGGAVEVGSDGAWVHASDGRSYLDFGGYGVFILGHRHPAVLDAVRRQLDTHPMSSRVFLEPTALHAAAALAAVSPGDLSMVHFTNSGAEATEAALKLACAAGSTAVITTRNGFHGKTMGALSVTSNDKYQGLFRPLLFDATEVHYGDATELQDALSAVDGRASVIVEPVQGEAGVIVPPDGYLRDVAALCRQHDALLIVDEIQTGLCRLGSWWGINADGVVPDILLAGKGLSGGVIPIAAVIATPAAYAPFANDPYLHTSTFAASPVACAAAEAALQVMTEHDIPARAATLGARIIGDIRESLTADGLDDKVVVRGRGLLIGIEAHQPGVVAELFLNLLDQGVLSNHSLNSSTVLRLTPPAILTDEEVDVFGNAFRQALADIHFQ